MPLCSEVWPFVLPQWWDTLRRFNWLGCLELRDHSAVCFPASRPDAWRDETASYLWTVSAWAWLSVLFSPPFLMDPAQDDDKVQKPGQRKKHKNLRTVGTPVSCFTPPGIGRPVPRDQLQGPRGPGTEVSSNSSQPVPSLSTRASEEGGKLPPLRLCRVEGTGPPSHPSP